MNADAFKPVVVAYRHGAAVRLDQLANVIDNVEDNKNASWLYTKAGARRAINLQVMRQPGSNTIEVTDAVRALLPSFQEALPPSVHLTIRGDRSKNIREAFSDIQWTMLITLLLVVGGDLRVPAQRIGDADSGAGAAVLDPRHVRRDAGDGLHPRQPLDDGAHPLDRLRGRRRHRHAREHRPSHRAG